MEAGPGGSWATVEEDAAAEEGGGGTAAGAGDGQPGELEASDAKNWQVPVSVRSKPRSLTRWLPIIWDGSSSAASVYPNGSELAKEAQTSTSGAPGQCGQDNKRRSQRKANNGYNNGQPTVFQLNLGCPKSLQGPVVGIRRKQGEKLRPAPLAIAWLLLIAYNLAALDCQRCLTFIRGAPASFEPLRPAIVLYAEATESRQSAPTATAAPVIKELQSMDNTTSNNNNNNTRNNNDTTPTTTTVATSKAVRLNESTATMAASNDTSKHDALPNDINKHRQPGRGSPVNVLCDSRCRCVLMESQVEPPAGQTNGTGTSTSNHNDNNNTTSSLASLLAFGEDYALKDADDDSASASSPEEPTEEEPLPRSLLMGGAEELSPSSPASKKSSSSALNMRQMFRLGLQDKQPHQAAGPRQQGPAVQLYAQAFYSKQPQHSPSSPPLKLSSSHLSSAHQVAGSGAPVKSAPNNLVDVSVVSQMKRIKTHPQLRPGFKAVSSASSGLPPLPPNVRLVELKTLDAAGHFSEYSLELETRPNGTRKPSDALINSTRHLLEQLDLNSINQPEALCLRGSNMSFELWCELYALLAPHFRKRIYQLDLSHNALPKLGLTFTGFIEHQLVALNGSWPSNQNQPQSATRTGSGPSPLGTGGQISTRPKQLLSSGLLYELVVAQTNLSSYYYHYNTHSQQIEIQLPPINNKLVVQETARSVKSQILTQPIQIRALDLSHNKIKWLINDQFRALKHVQAIRLDHNRIRYIHRHAFSGLEWLKYLNLNYNKLQVIYTEQFQTNYKLLAIRLRNNYLAYLRGGSFTSLSNLRRLDVSQNKLTLVSANAFVGLESLEYLNCSGNQFLQVPSTSLHPLISLRQLDLSNNLLGQLMPGAFFHLPIVELWLQNNSQLSDIERGAFWDLPYLRQLHLSGNPSLANVNTQAFVGTPNLCVIEAEQCPLLDSETRQLFDNTTTATVMRMLRLEMLAGNNSSIGEAHQMINSTTSNITTVEQSVLSSIVSQNPLLPAEQQELTPAHLLAVVAPAASLASQKYLYFLATIALLAIVIKLLFKYTSSSRYLTSVRQRRRVYEANSELAELSLTLPSLDQNLHHHNSLCTTGRPSVIPSASSYSPASASAVGQLDHCQDEPPAATGQHVGPQSADISVISDSMCEYLQQEQHLQVQMELQMHNMCSQCPLPGCQASSGLLDETNDTVEAQQCYTGQEETNHHQLEVSNSSMDLIHNQLIAAGYECGHANCAHFYQSLAPALHLADIAAGTDYC